MCSAAGRGLDAVGADVNWNEGLEYETVLLAPEAFCPLYVHWLCAQMDLALGETARAMNELQVYSDYLQEFCRMDAEAVRTGRWCAVEVLRDDGWNEPERAADEPPDAAGLGGLNEGYGWQRGRVQRGNEFFQPGIPGRCRRGKCAGMCGRYRV